MPLQVEIVTAERKVLETEADMVIAPGGEGVVGILPKHAPLLTTLLPGVLTLKRGGAEEYLSIAGGFLQVSRDRVLILADAAEREEEIDEARAERARARAEELLRQAGQGGAPVQTEAARLALRRSLARLDVARRRRRAP